MSRLLIIDDDEAIVDALAIALEDEGHVVDRARNGRIGLERMVASPPELILLDLMMPEMDGYELRRVQLQDPALAAIPTIVVTAGGIDQRVIDMKTQGWLLKPIRLEVLLDVIAKHSLRPPRPALMSFIGLERALERRDEHAVVIYESPAELAALVANHLAAGLAQGESAIAVVVPARREAVGAALEAAGIDVAAEERSGRLRFVDAETMMATFMVRHVPNEARFRAGVDALLESARAASRSGRVRAYGEMVDVLWRAGNVAAALTLEEFWNRALAVHGASLVCAYVSPGGVSDAEGALREICARHTVLLAG